MYRYVLTSKHKSCVVFRNSISLSADDGGGWCERTLWYKFKDMYQTVPPFWRQNPRKLPPPPPQLPSVIFPELYLLRLQRPTTYKHRTKKTVFVPVSH